MSIEKLINKVVEKEDLSEIEAMDAMNRIMEGQVTPAQIAALITGLKMKGESEEEIAGFAKTMRRKALSIPISSHNLVDTCGTGGDNRNTFNISTATAFVVAAAGLKVAKHGNRSVTSKSGSADVLEALGVNLDLTPRQVGECIENIGIGFLFAPKHHQAMKYAVEPRKQLKMRTIFNMLGPLTNPAGAKAQLIGVYSPELPKLTAQVLNRLGVERAYVVHGLDGMDEISINSNTLVSELKDGQVKNYEFNPESLGIAKRDLAEVAGGTPDVNAEIITRVFKGEPGAHRDIVVLNSAFALEVGGAVKSISDGVKLANKILDSRAALNKLEQLANYTRRAIA